MFDANKVVINLCCQYCSDINTGNPNTSSQISSSLSSVPCPLSVSTGNLINFFFFFKIILSTSRSSLSEGPMFCAKVTYHVIGVQHFAQQFWNWTLGLHGGVRLTQVHRDPQRPLAVHQPSGNRENALLHIGCWGKTAQLLKGHHGILGIKNIHREENILVRIHQKIIEFWKIRNKPF